MDTKDTITITRDSYSHAWSIVQGSHNIPTPWRDTADAVSVVTWIKAKMGGQVKVHVQL
jgi:hypothetical protein